jgi:hypothetical protein
MTKSLLVLWETVEVGNPVCRTLYFKNSNQNCRTVSYHNKL